MQSPNFSRFHWLLLGLSILFLVVAPFNSSMFPDSSASRAASALWLVAASVAVVFSGKYRWIAFFALFLVLSGLLYSSYSKSFGLENLVNDEKFSDVIGDEKLDFGSTPWFIFGVAIKVAIAAVAARICLLKVNDYNSNTSGGRGSLT